MKFGLVAKILGNLLLIEAATFFLPLAVSLYYKEHLVALAFLYALVITGLIGLALSSLRVQASRLRIRDALLVVTLGWIFVAFFGALPFIFSGSVPNLVDAFFEAVSGFTTTGATVIQDVEILPKGIMFWRALAQWLGGMGILVLTLAILPRLGMAGFQVFRAESPGPHPEKFTPRLAATGKILYTLYVTFTLVQTLMMRAAGLPWFESVLVAFGTWGTGGIGIHNDSLIRYSTNGLLINFITLGMVLSGVNFSLYHEILKRRWKQVTSNSELRWYLGIVVVCGLAVAVNLYGTVYTSLGETIKQAFFQVSSVLTTTGFASADLNLWPPFSKGILFALMFVGGSAGSTSGSIKVIRFVVAAKVVKREISRTLHPQAMRPIIVNGRTMPLEVVQGVGSFYLLYFSVFVIGSLLISLEGLELISAMGTVAASLGNIGLGIAEIGPQGTFAFFSPVGKLFLAFLMLLGRLELFTLLVVLTPKFWRD